MTILKRIIKRLTAWLAEDSHNTVHECPDPVCGCKFTVWERVREYYNCPLCGGKVK